MHGRGRSHERNLRRQAGCGMRKGGQGRCVAPMPRALGADPGVPRRHVPFLGFLGRERPADSRETLLRSARIRPGDTTAVDGAVRSRGGQDVGEWWRISRRGLSQRCESIRDPRITEALSGTGSAKHRSVCRAGSEQAGAGGMTKKGGSNRARARPREPTPRASRSKRANPSSSTMKNATPANPVTSVKSMSMSTSTSMSTSMKSSRASSPGLKQRAPTRKDRRHR